MTTGRGGGTPVRPRVDDGRAVPLPPARGVKKVSSLRHGQVSLRKCEARANFSAGTEKPLLLNILERNRYYPLPAADRERARRVQTSIPETRKECKSHPDAVVADGDQMDVHTSPNSSSGGASPRALRLRELTMSK